MQGDQRFCREFELTEINQGNVPGAQPQPVSRQVIGRRKNYSYMTQQEAQIVIMQPSFQCDPRDPQSRVEWEPLKEENKEQ